jgi:hypothetical protein
MQGDPHALFPLYSVEGFFHHYAPSYPFCPMESIFSGLRFRESVKPEADTADGREDHSGIGRLFDTDRCGINGRTSKGEYWKKI